MKLYLIRHGISTANLQRRYAGVWDVDLAPEAFDALEELKNQGIYPSIEGKALYTSGMRRTEQTFKAIFGDVEHEVLHEFKELNFGVFEKSCYDELEGDEAYMQWAMDTTGEFCCPQGESKRMVFDRVMSAIQMLKADGRDAIVVCHGAVTAILLSYLFGDGNGTNYFDYLPLQGRGYCIDFSPNSITYEKIG